MNKASVRVQLVASKYLPEYTGAAYRIHRTYKRLETQHPIEWSVICGGIELTGTENYFYDNVHVSRVGFSSWIAHLSVRKSFRKLGEALKAYLDIFATIVRLMSRRYDVVHVFGMSPVTAAAIFWARVARKPIIIELVTAKATPRQPFPGLARIWFLDLSRRSVIVCISSALRETCARQGLTKSIWQRPNPVDCTRFRFHVRETCDRTLRQSTAGSGVHLVGMIASFMPQKNQIFLLDVISRLPEAYRLVIAGPVAQSGLNCERDHRYLRQIEERIRDLQLSDRVELIPHFVDSAEIIRRLDIYLLPNMDEGLATPMLEAMASGVPVIANADEPAFKQWVVDGKNGFLRTLQPDIWASAISEASATFSDQQRREMSTSICEQVSQDDHDRRLLTLLDRLVCAGRHEQLDVERILATNG